MKFWSIFLSVSLIFIINEIMVQASSIPIRGIVEGFYGKPWTFEERKEILSFCRQHKFNAYIYAPKDDPYHRDKWREMYPIEEIMSLKSLVDIASENRIRFIFAISPGIDLNYTNEEDFCSVIEKLESMYSIGVRDFAILFDDIEHKTGIDGEFHAELVNKIQKALRRKYDDIGIIITVPTEYSLQDMINEQEINSYTENFSKGLDKSILVLYSGNRVVTEGISDRSFKEACKIYKRRLGVWWNYPVNDYNVTEEGKRAQKLALGAIEKLPHENLRAIFFNPMEQMKLSKIALATGADYALAPKDYDAERSWNEAIEEQYGKLAPAMKLFAEHSRHLENSWAKIGESDSPTFAKLADDLLESLRGDKIVNFEPLEKEIIKLEKATDILIQELPQDILNECLLQLKQLKRIVYADKIALASLKARRLDPQLINLNDQINSNEKTAAISERAARKFVTDVLNFFQTDSLRTFIN